MLKALNYHSPSKKKGILRSTQNLPASFFRMGYIFNNALNERKLIQISVIFNLWGEVEAWLKVESTFNEILHFRWHYVLLFRLSLLSLRNEAFQNPRLVALPTCLTEVETETQGN